MTAELLAEIRDSTRVVERLGWQLDVLRRALDAELERAAALLRRLEHEQTR